MPSVPDAAVEFFDPEPEPLWTFAYVSRPTVPFTEIGLRQLHLAAQQWNGRHGVTGRLVVVEEGETPVRFVQCIEGPRSEVEACARRIFSDGRHGDIEVIQSTKLDARRFPKWGMQFERADADALDGDVAVALWGADASAPDLRVEPGIAPAG